MAIKSIKKLQDAIQCINERMSTAEVANAKSLIMQFIADNEESPKREKLSCGMFTKGTKDYDSEARKAMCCIYHDPVYKVAVATDARAIYASESEYIPTEGNGLRNAYGQDPTQSILEIPKKNGKEQFVISEMGDKFPKWRQVIPNNTVNIEIREDLEQAYREAIAAAKSLKVKDAEHRVIINVSESPDIWMTARHAKFIICAGLEGWKIRDDYKGGLIKTWSGQTLMLMNSYMEDDSIKRPLKENKEMRYVIKSY